MFFHNTNKYSGFSYATSSDKPTDLPFILETTWQNSLQMGDQILLIEEGI